MCATTAHTLVPGHVYETPDKPQPSDYHELSTRRQARVGVQSQYVNQTMPTTNAEHVEYEII